MHITGEIDAETAPALTARLDEMLDPATTACVDLSGVTFMDSSGIRVLVLQFMRFQHSGGHLEISGASSMVRRVFDISGAAELVQWKAS